jgi:hypothetical protein
MMMIQMIETPLKARKHTSVSSKCVKHTKLETPQHGTPTTPLNHNLVGNEYQIIGFNIIQALMFSLFYCDWDHSSSILIDQMCLDINRNTLISFLPVTLVRRYL